MNLAPTSIPGVFVVTPAVRDDERGAFIRLFGREEFEEQGLSGHVEQVALSTNTVAGTVRGLHYQLPPLAETKLVRCTQGSILDVAVDLRVDSPTFASWFGVELTATGHRALWIPQGCAHGFQTLTDHTHVLYQIGASYDPDLQRGIHHEDPQVGVQWPLPVSRISERDAGLPTLEDAELP